jgi:hypothetical protein
MKTDHTAYRRVARLVLAVAFLLMLPLLAMQVTDQVVWDLADFAVAGALLVGAGLMYDGWLLPRRTPAGQGDRCVLPANAIASGLPPDVVHNDMAFL